MLVCQRVTNPPKELILLVQLFEPQDAAVAKSQRRPPKGVGPKSPEVESKYGGWSSRIKQEHGESKVSNIPTPNKHTNKKYQAWWILDTSPKKQHVRPTQPAQ